MIKPKDNYSYMKGFRLESERDETCSRLVDIFKQRKISFVINHPIGRAYPEYQNFLLDLQRIDRKGEKPYELYVQVYSKRQIPSTDIPLTISQALNLEGLTLVS